ncbi:unnamed protein product [Pedinophyceae sp. YPF-701]|nr:unnamed protein product [Pedinophyceae sp. YPF-701]
MLPVRRPPPAGTAAEKLLTRGLGPRTTMVLLSLVLLFIYLEFSPPLLLTAMIYGYEGELLELDLTKTLVSPANTLPFAPTVCKRVVKHAFKHAHERMPKLGEVAVAKMDGIKMAIYGKHTDIVSDAIRESGDWEANTWEILQSAMEEVERQEGERPTFVDIGAHIGWFSFRAIKAGYRVFSFEAMPTNLAALLETHCLNGPARLHRHTHAVYAVAASNGKKDCKLVSHSSNVGDGILECDENWKPADGYQAMPRMGMNTIDNLIKDELFNPSRLSVVKMDVSGHEMFVMEGAHDWLASNRRPKVVFSEIWKLSGTTSKYIRLMIEHGYEVYVREKDDGNGFEKLTENMAMEFAKAWETGKALDHANPTTDVIFAQPAYVPLLATGHFRPRYVGPSAAVGA